MMKRETNFGRIRKYKALMPFFMAAILTACGGGGGGGGAPASSGGTGDGPGDDDPTAVRLSNTKVMKDVAGAEVGRIIVEDPDTDINYRINVVSIDKPETSKFELSAGGAVLKLKATEYLAEGQQESVTLCVNGCATLQRSFTITVDSLPGAIARTANNFYPVFSGMELDVLLGQSQVTPQPLTLTFGDKDNASGAFPLAMDVKVPSANNPDNLLDAKITEYMISRPATAEKPLGELVLKRYDVFAPKGVAVISNIENPAMTINIELLQPLVIFSQALINKPSQPITISAADNRSAKVTITGFGERTLTYTGQIAIEEITGNGARLPTLPEAVDVSRSPRKTYNIVLSMTLDLSSMPSIFGIKLPDSVRVQSNMTLAEGVGFTERTLSVVDVPSSGAASVLNITGTFHRGAIDRDSDPDDDLWLNSVDRYPNNASGH